MMEFVPQVAGAAVLRHSVAMALLQSVADTTAVPADDSVPMRFDEFDEILDRLQPAAFRAVAPAPQIPGRLPGVQVVGTGHLLARQPVCAVVRCLDLAPSPWMDSGSSCP